MGIKWVCALGFIFAGSIVTALNIPPPKKIIVPLSTPSRFASHFPPSYSPLSGLIWDNGRVDRFVEGPGFHKHVLTNISVSTSSSVKSLSACDFFFVEHVSEFIYYDLDELKMHEPFGGVPFHSFESFIDVEKPSSVSFEHRIAFRTRPQMVHLSKLKDKYVVTAHFKIPFHVRYQDPSQDADYRLAPVFPPLAVFIACQSKNTIESDEIGRSGWQQLDVVSNGELSVSVPVGRSREHVFVNIATFLGIWCGAGVIFYAMVISPGPGDHDKKQ
jgi:hypothetical protein